MKPRVYQIIIMVVMLVATSSCNSIPTTQALFTQSSGTVENLPSQESSTTPAPALASSLADAEIIPINNEWNKYSNYRLGFAMHVPASMYRDDAGCYWHEQGDNSYRPEGGKVPVVVIEGDDRVYITSKYNVVLVQKTQVPTENGYQYKYEGCEWLENNLALVENRDYSSYIWEIVLRRIETDADLELLIDEYYGTCFSLGEVLPEEGKEYYSVKVLGDGKPVEESECLLRGGYMFLYSEELQIAATWKTGQMMHFCSLGANEGAYDGAMISSFEFIRRDQEP